MDIVSHALWAGVGAHVLRRKFDVSRKAQCGIVALAVVPDVVPMLPLVAWALAGPDPLSLIYSYIVSTPGTEPLLPPLLTLIIHHLHCSMHSAVIVGAITALAWVLTRCFPWMILGWWSHVLLDIPTHSAEYYKVSALYPFADGGLDGIAWTDPWFLATNYCTLAIVYLFLAKQHLAH